MVTWPCAFRKGFNITETVGNAKSMKARYHISEKLGKRILKLGLHQVLKEIGYAYTASDYAIGQDISSLADNTL